MRVVYTGPEPGLRAVRDAFGASAEVVAVAEDQEVVTRAIRDADVYFVSLKVRLDRPMIEGAARLKVVVSPTTGVDHVDAEALEERDIPLYSLVTERELLRSITPTSELSLLLLLATARHFRAAVAQPLAGEWDGAKLAGPTMNGRTLGVVGMGRLGGWMTRYALALGMRVLGYDPSPADAWPEGAERVDFETLLAGSDFITIHVPLTPETMHMFDAAAFARMRPGAILINTARGAVIDTHALIAALESGQLAAAGIDVLEWELEMPIAEHPLVRYAAEHDNVIITPHMGGKSDDAIYRTTRHVADKAAARLGVAG